LVVIPKDQLEEGIDDCGGKDFEKTVVLRTEDQTHDLIIDP